jgi:hypothetical protein
LINLRLEALAVFLEGSALLAKSGAVGGQGVVLRLQAFVPPGRYA